MKPPKEVTAFAPASIGNVAVGFDILGMAMEGVGDEVTLSPSGDRSDLVIESVNEARVSCDVEKNTATVALMKFLIKSGLNHGFNVKIKKGIPLSSGMGGSAASAVAAVVAANAFLDRSMNFSDLLECAVSGEALASGGMHADNVAPSLHGGLVLVQPRVDINGVDFKRVAAIPVPPSIRCVVAHPHLEIHTRDARAILKPDLSLKDHVAQSANLAGFLTGCFQGDMERIRGSLVDQVIEPQRSSLIPGFAQAKANAIAAGALGFSISGAGPSVFAWARSDSGALQIGEAIKTAFAEVGLKSDFWISKGNAPGARVIQIS